MTKQKTTVYLDADVLTATKAAALTSKRSGSAVIEDALLLDELTAVLGRPRFRRYASEADVVRFVEPVPSIAEEAGLIQAG